MLTHVTSKCSLQSLAIATSANGISSHIYGPWLRSKNGEFLKFLSTSEDAHQQAIVDLEELKRLREHPIAMANSLFPFSVSETQQEGH